MVKHKVKRLGSKVSKPGPLTEQIVKEELVVPPKRNKKRTDKQNDQYVEGSLGQNIMKQSLAQLQEIVKEEEDAWPALGAPTKRHQIENHSDSESSEDDTKNTIVVQFAEELNVDEDDIHILKYFSKEKSPQQRLSDLFQAKFSEIHIEILNNNDAEIFILGAFGANLSPEVQEMCKEIGKILARYRSGPLPKMFKTFPTMACWEELVYLTNPDKWSAAAMYQAARYFISSLKAAMAQRFVCLVFLPRVRDDISYYKRLNYHLYQGLIKILFKSAAFFKGIVFPLCEAGDCTLREAIIIGSVIAKNHISIEHSCAAIKTIAAMEYSGPSSIFLRILFDKKYALPYQVLDEVYDHFMRFQSDKRELPVLWHQSFLAFVQRYKNDLSHDQVMDLLHLVKIHSHYKITPEIDWELSNSTYRKSDEPMHAD